MRYLLLLFLLHPLLLLSQTEEFTAADTIFGALSPERSWWDVHFYHLDVKVDPENKWIEGKNSIHYIVLKSDSIMQIDLRPPLEIISFIQDGQHLDYTKKHFSYFVKLKKPQNKDEQDRKSTRLNSSH